MQLTGLVLILLALFPLNGMADSSSNLSRNGIKLTAYADCEKDPGGAVSKEKFVAFVSETIESGLDRIAEINPALLNEAMRNLKHRNVAVHCGIDRSFYNNGALHRGGLAYSDRFYLGANSKFIESLQSGELDKLEVAHFKNTILHEFLHVLSFDNVPLESHNHELSDSKGGFKDSRGLRDVVYACSGAAIPDWSTPDPVVVKGYGVQRTVIPKDNWLSACDQCAKATWAPSEMRYSDRYVVIKGGLDLVGSPHANRCREIRSSRISRGDYVPSVPVRPSPGGSSSVELAGSGDQ